MSQTTDNWMNGGTAWSCLFCCQQKKLFWDYCARLFEPYSALSTYNAEFHDTSSRGYGEPCWVGSGEVAIYLCYASVCRWSSQYCCFGFAIINDTFDVSVKKFRIPDTGLNFGLGFTIRVFGSRHKDETPIWLYRPCQDVTNLIQPMNKWLFPFTV